MRVRRNASSTATDSGRRASIAKPRWITAMPARAATSSHTSRERIARCQVSPAPWPVTVTKPKFRTEAPLARASRSSTRQESPRRRAAKAWARPRMPAPTTTNSKERSTAHS